MKAIGLVLVCSVAVLAHGMATQTTIPEGTQEAPLSGETETCVECHRQSNPGIVIDWMKSRHAQVTPESALHRLPLERRVSSGAIPEELRSVAVGCYECHSLNPSLHKDSFEHFGAHIHVIVSPNDCRTCHSTEVEQYAESKKARAVDNLRMNPVYTDLVEAIISVKTVEDKGISRRRASNTAEGETCYDCHGTNVSVAGLKVIPSGLGEIEVPDLRNWPNQGVGRVNPDGSYGACTACHPRHSFSIEIARKPYTCGQCHLEPDVPSYNVYKESKHGNIMDSKKHEWNWSAVPWRVGEDFRAPTCAVCHNSLIATPEGHVIVPRTHDFGARLWVRLFGLIYSHPQPKSGKTYLVKNEDTLPLPTTLTGSPASEYLIDPSEQLKRQDRMKRLCQSCHSAGWVSGHFTQLDTAIIETDSMVLAATQLLLDAWNRGVADKSNLFDEAIEQKWIEQWLFYANSNRYASAMAGPDYASFKSGWWKLTHTLQAMKDHIKLSGRTKK